MCIKGLKEWNFGVFEGESEDLNPKLPYGDFFKAFGGEGEIEVRERMNQTLTEIMEKLEPHLSQGVGINRSTYFRWRDSALKAVEGILWGYEEESRRLLEHYRDTWREDL